jgi:hypothetical protein
LRETSGLNKSKRRQRSPDGESGFFVFFVPFCSNSKEIRGPVLAVAAGRAAFFCGKNVGGEFLWEWALTGFQIEVFWTHEDDN